MIGDKVERLLKPLVKGTKLENCKGCKRRKENLNKLDRWIRSRLTRRESSNG